MIDRSTIGILDMRYFDPPEPEVDLDLLLESLPDNLRDVVPEPEPVLLIDHSFPSPNPSSTTAQQAAPASDVSETVCVPAYALFEILDDFIADQHQLAPITSSAGYLDFKRNFNTLTGPLIAHQLLEPYVRDRYFAAALHLAPSDRAEIDAALAASYEFDPPYAVALVDTTLCQYFQPKTGSFLVSPPVYEPDEDGFALRQPPSCPLFDFTVPTHSPTLDAHSSSHAKFDHILDEPIHSGSYENKEAKVSAYSHQHVSQHQSSLDIPIIQPYDAATTPSSVDPSLRSLHHDIAPTVWLDLQPSADMSPATVPISASPEVHRSLEAPDPVYVLTVAESTVSPLFEASVPPSKPPLRSLKSDLAAAEYLTEEWPEYRLPLCPVVACALPSETVVSIAGLSSDQVPVQDLATLPPEHPPELPFPPHHVWSRPGGISDSTIPPPPLQFTKSDLAVVTLPPEEPPVLSIPLRSSQRHATTPPVHQELPEYEDIVRSTTADGVVSLSALFEYAKLLPESAFGQPSAASTPQRTSPKTSETELPDVAQISVEVTTALPLESVASIVTTPPSTVPVESILVLPPEPCLATSSPIPHEPAIYKGTPITAVASESVQQVQVKSEPDLVVVVVQDEQQHARSTLTPHTAMPIVVSPSSSLSSHVNRLRAYPFRSQRRPPKRLGSRTRLHPSSSRLCHNTPHARTVLAPRVRVPGSDPPPCSATFSRTIDRASSRRPSVVRPRTV